jgi:predicted Rossmann-fold nucleotide-binding protein
LRNEIRSPQDLRDFLRSTDRDWSNVNVVGLDLREPQIDDALLREEFTATTAFVGCAMGGALARKVASAEALVIPGRTGPFDPFRGRMYEAAELLARFDAADPATYFDTPDWRCYLASMDLGTKRKRSDLGLDDAIFFRLHDLAIEDALIAYLRPRGGRARRVAPRRVVGIMGGHDRERLEKLRLTDGSFGPTDAPYMTVALLAWKLSREGFTIATGGGPGAMEAANLGAWFAGRSEDELRAAVRMLERVPKVGPAGPDSTFWNSGSWLGPAFEVIERFPRDVTDPHTESVGVPTWFYGHEPPNPFASHIAKFFENSLREEGVLAIANCGVIFAEGNAGTVQEIFQDACQNYYATHGASAPMVLLGSEYWNRSDGTPKVEGAKTVWPLLRQLGEEKGFARLLRLSDDIDEIVTFLKESAKVSDTEAAQRDRLRVAP